jgi:hypothetical protein
MLKYLLKEMLLNLYMEQKKLRHQKILPLLQLLLFKLLKEKGGMFKNNCKEN